MAQKISECVMGIGKGKAQGQGQGKGKGVGIEVWMMLNQPFRRYEVRVFFAGERGRMK
jgi:hypothetical protein